MGLLVPLLVHEPSGVQMSNVYMSFSTQMIRVLRVFYNTDQNIGPPEGMDKFKICGYANVKPSPEYAYDSITYYVEDFVDDPTVNPYTVLYNKLKSVIPSTVDC